MPTPDTVERAIASTADLEQRRYFFTKLENPLWVAPLAEKGFFATPPEPIPSGDGGFQLPFWPESQYLARVASGAPEAVVAVAAKIQTDNPRVLEDIVDIALAIGKPGAPGELLHQVKAFAKNPFSRWQYGKLGKLAVHWAKLGARDEALVLLALLTRFSPDPKQMEKEKLRESGASALFTRTEPNPPYDEYVYRQILQSDVPNLAEIMPWDVTETLVRNLNEAIDLSFSNSKDLKAYDASDIWCRDLKQPEKHDHGTKGPLGRALTKCCETLLIRQPDRFGELNTLLRRQEWHFFSRLRWLLYSEFPLLAKSLMRDEAVSYNHYAEVDYGFEFASMLQKANEVSAIEDIDLERIFQAINSGPDMDEYRKWVTSLGHKVSEEQFQARKEYFFIKQMFPFASVLPRFQLYWSKYQALAQKHRAITLSDFYRHRMEAVSGFAPNTSPVTVSELSSKTNDELLTFLNAWQPPQTRDELLGPNVFGLASVFGQVVKQDPERFLQIADQIMLPNNATCVREFLHFLVDRVKQKQSVPWERVISLCTWVIQQRASGLERDQSARDIWKWGDPDFTSCRQSIAELLQHGSYDYEGAIPWQSRQNIFSILLHLCRDYDPRLDERSHFGQDFLTEAINSVRGEAVHALVNHALWVKRHAKLQKGAMSQMLEVKDLLEERLNPSQESSLAVHAMFGLLTPWLFHLDRDWFTTVQALVFPCDAEDQARWIAAWTTYVGWNHVDKSVFENIEQEYRRAAKNLHLLRVKDTSGRPVEGMCEHLVILYGMGAIPLSGDNVLLQSFLEQANAKERAYMMHYAGRALENTEVVLEELKDRLRAYWEFRLRTAKTASKPQEFSEELSEFEWWFRSGKLDTQWCLSQIQELLVTTKSVSETLFLLEDLAKVSNQYPAETVACLASLVRNSSAERYMYLDEKHVKAILTSALDSKNPEAIELASSTQDNLVRLGRFEYKDL